jgi:hypothetical protein
MFKILEDGWDYVRNLFPPARQDCKPAMPISMSQEYVFWRLDSQGRRCEFLGHVEVFLHDTHKISKAVPRIDAFMRELVAEYE